MIKVNPILFYVFVFGLIVFTVISASFWSGGISGGKMLLSFVFLETVCLFTLIINANRLLKVRPLILLALLWFLTVPFIVVLSRGSLFDLLSVILWPLCLLTTYVFVKYNSHYFTILLKAFILIFCIGVVFFLMHRLDSGRNPHIIDVLTQQRTNIIYFPLLTLPWLLCIKNKYLKNILFLSLFAIVVFSLKRSAILVMLVMLIPFVKTNAKVFQKYKVFNAVIFLLFFSFFGYAFYKVNEIVGAGAVSRIAAMSEDQGSSRIGIYEEVIDLQLSAGLPEWIMGHGHFGVSKTISWEMSAHNDFLEVLFNYGTILFLLYLSLWFIVLLQMKKLYSLRSPLFLAYLSSISIFFIFSMVSHLILYPSYFIYIVSFWGGIQALQEKSPTIGSEH